MLFIGYSYKIKVLPSFFITLHVNLFKIHGKCANICLFTRNKANTILYATALEWPGETLTIKTLSKSDLSQLKSVKILGSKKKLRWKQTSKGLEITMPSKPDYDFAYPVKLEFKEQLPTVNL